MPGREDLIQQNISRAKTKAKVDSAQQQPPTGGEKPALSSHRSLFGANLDVVSALDSMEFSMKGPLGDGSLRNSVAYIRRWKRAGSKSTAETTTQAIDATQLDPGTDPQSELNRVINERYGIEREGAQLIQYTSDFTAAVVTGEDGTTTRISTEVIDTAQGRIVQTNIDPDNVVINDDGEIESGFMETRIARYNEKLSVDQAQQEIRQVALATQSPSTKPTTTTLPGTVADSSQKKNGQSALGTNYRTSGVGKLKPANPNGFVNPAQSKRTDSKSNFTPAKSGTLTEGMWQFLFNPSELEVNAGPEFKTAETWGVSDKANSGQPLNWSHNKNAQLKFNSVLLNGYVFGRKVEELEQGIFELFMARDGEGQDGPPVLEFVWGKRVFGPCVIKEISIKEKMWDEGEVVNAELSFTLEQVPEWTINDGYVDVARPGRIPMVYDATEQSQGATSASTPAGPSSSDPGEGDNPDQKSSEPAGQKSGDAKLCDFGLKQSKQLQQLYVKLDNPLFIPYWDINDLKSQFYSIKGNLYSSSVELSTYVDNKLQSGCKKSAYRKTIEDILKSKDLFVPGDINRAEKPETRAYQFMRACTETTKKALDQWVRTSKKCEGQRTTRRTYERTNGTPAQQKLCAKYSGKCSTPGERFGTAGQCPFVNNNRGVVCSGGVWTPL